MEQKKPKKKNQRRIPLEWVMLLMMLLSLPITGGANVIYTLSEQDRLITLDFSIAEAQDVIGYILSYRFDPEALQPINQSLKDTIFSSFSNALEVAQAQTFGVDAITTLSSVLYPDEQGHSTFSGSGRLGSMAFQRLNSFSTILQGDQVEVFYGNGDFQYFSLDISIAGENGETEPTITTTATTTTTIPSTTPTLRKKRIIEEEPSPTTSTTTTQLKPKIVVFPRTCPQCPEQPECKQSHFWEGMFYGSGILLAIIMFLFIRKIDKLQRGGAES